MQAAAISDPAFFSRHGLWSAWQRYQFLAAAAPAAAAVPWCWLDQHPVCAHRVTDPENEGEAEYQLDMSGQRFLAAREAAGPASRQLLPVMPARRRTDADGRWKDALDVYFQPCLQLFWPSLHALIDWRQPPQFLDKELQALTLSKGRNRRYVDKLASVQLLQGERICLLVHMEVQARLQAGFAGRMFEYFVRLRETYPDQPIVQLAIVTRGRPDQDRLAYCYEPLGKNFLSLNFSLPMLNLQGWRDRDAELAALAAHNPFALLVQAELAAARQDSPSDRLQHKVRLLRQLYRHGYGGLDFRRLFAFLDGILSLPPEQEIQFVRAMNHIDSQAGGSNMPYITSIERVAIGRGRLEGKAEGMRDALRCLLEQRFGRLPETARERLQQAGQEDLQHGLSQVLKAHSLDEVLPRQ